MQGSVPTQTVYVDISVCAQCTCMCVCAPCGYKWGHHWQQESLAPTQAHERLEETKLEAVRDNNVELVQEILHDIGHLVQQDSAAAELARILREPHFQVWQEACKPCACKVHVQTPHMCKVCVHKCVTAVHLAVPTGDL